MRDKYGSSFICSPHIERPMPSMHEVIELPQYWCFTMKYYYFFYRQDEIYNGQVSGIFHEHDSEGEKIHRGSSVISLSLDTGGCPVWEYSKDARLPWRLLVLTCSKRRVEPIPLRNAIEAFLYAITCEMKNVHAQLYNLSARVAAIAVPSVCISDLTLFRVAIRLIELG